MSKRPINECDCRSRIYAHRTNLPIRKFGAYHRIFLISRRVDHDRLNVITGVLIAAWINIIFIKIISTQLIAIGKAGNAGPTEEGWKLFTVIILSRIIEEYDLIVRRIYIIFMKEGRIEAFVWVICDSYRVNYLLAIIAVTVRLSRTV